MQRSRGNVVDREVAERDEAGAPPKPDQGHRAPRPRYPTERWTKEFHGANRRKRRANQRGQRGLSFWARVPVAKLRRQRLDPKRRCNRWLSRQAA